MRTKFLPSPALCFGFVTLIASPCFGEESKPSAPPPPPAAPASSAEPANVHTGASTFGIQTDPAAIATPPPAPRTETKPAAPSPTHAWVRGHYRPMKGEWHWVPGVWAIPATAQSVWIEGSYDRNAKRWSEGHWQPDGTPAPKTDVLQKAGPAKQP